MTYDPTNLIAHSTSFDFDDALQSVGYKQAVERKGSMTYHHVGNASTVEVIYNTNAEAYTGIAAALVGGSEPSVEFSGAVPLGVVIALLDSWAWRTSAEAAHAVKHAEHAERVAALEAELAELRKQAP